MNENALKLNDNRYLSGQKRRRGFAIESIDKENKDQTNFSFSFHTVDEIVVGGERTSEKILFKDNLVEMNE